MNETAITFDGLLTVAGAGAAAFVAASFARTVWELSARAIRVVAAMTGLLFVLAAQTITLVDNPDPLSAGAVAGFYLVSVIVGMQAGLSAVAMVDTIRKGLNYQAVAPPVTPEEAEEIKEESGVTVIPTTEDDNPST